MNRVVTRIYDVATGVLTKHPDSMCFHHAGDIAGTDTGDVTTAWTAVTGRAPKVGDHVSWYDTSGTAYHISVYRASDWQVLV